MSRSPALGFIARILPTISIWNLEVFDTALAIGEDLKSIGYDGKFKI